MNRILPLVMLIVASSIFSCKTAEWTDISEGQLIIIQSTHAPFPHPKRAMGHTYGDSLYSFEEHYNDSSVAIFIPDNYTRSKTVDLVFYFHGWGNNIQKSIEKFKLLEQFTRSSKNAIFVFPEGPKNSKDSFGGRLEEMDEFKALVSDVLSFLIDEEKIISTTPGSIVLSGHSGAYRVISYILDRGGLSEYISEVYLFDALYAEEDKYLSWLQTYDGRLVNLITPNGGTLDNSLGLLADMDSLDIPFTEYSKNEISPDELTASKRIFIFTSLGHSEVINPYFELALKTSQLQNF